MDSTVNANLLFTSKNYLSYFKKYHWIFNFEKIVWVKSDLLQGTVHWFWDEEILPWLG